MSKNRKPPKQGETKGRTVPPKVTTKPQQATPSTPKHAGRTVPPKVQKGKK